MEMPARHRFWLRTRRLTLALLLIWLSINLALPWFARELDAFSVFGFPLGYWLSAEGALLLYLLIIVAYVFAMDRLEAGLVAEEAQDAGSRAMAPHATDAGTAPNPKPGPGTA